MANDVVIKIGAVDNASRVFRQVSGRLRRFGSGVTRIANRLAPFVAGGGMIGAIVGTTSNVRKQLGTLDELAKTADRLGIATEDLQAFRLAAEEGGASVETLDKSLERMARRISDAAQGSGEAVDALKELGLSADELNQAGPSEAFRHIADAMQGVQNESDRLRISYDLFGREGMKLVNTLNGGSEALDEMKRQMEELGATVDREALRNIEAANDAMTELSKGVDGLSQSLTILAAGPLTTVVEKLTDVVKATQQLKNARPILDRLMAYGSEENLRRIARGQPMSGGQSAVLGGISQMIFNDVIDAFAPGTSARKRRGFTPRQFGGGFGPMVVSVDAAPGGLASMPPALRAMLERRAAERGRKEMEEAFGISPSKRNVPTMGATEGRLLMRGRGTTPMERIEREAKQQTKLQEELDKKAGEQLTATQNLEKAMAENKWTIQQVQ